MKVRKYLMIIDDVACDKCINRIKSALDLLPGVISIKQQLWDFNVT
jgi:copper chaperone CopZ